jgi:hypothetical protein
VAIVALLAVELYLVSLPAARRQPGSPRALLADPGWAALERESQEENGPGRFDSRSLYHVNAGELFGLEDIRGLSPLRPRRLAAFSQIPLARRWQLLNVTHVLSASEAGDLPLTRVASYDRPLVAGGPANVTLYRVDLSRPRGWMSFEPILVADEAAALGLLADPAFDPARQVILHTPVAENVAPPAEAPLVTVARVAPGRLRINATTSTPGYLVISEWNYPGWGQR